MSMVVNAQVMNVIGDSYVANHRQSYELTWHYLLAQKLQMTYNNYGRNGSCIAFDRTHDGPYNFGPAMWQRCTAMDTNADYVIIIAGHNDADKCGNNRDSLTMFADSLELFLTTVERHCPRAAIGFVTPWYVDSPGFQPVCEIIRDTCEKHHIPVLWNFSDDCVIQVRDATFREKYFQSPTDVAHLNAEGHLLFLQTAEDWFTTNLLHHTPQPVRDQPR